MSFSEKIVRIRTRLFDFKFLLVLFAVLALFSSVQSYLNTRPEAYETGNCTKYNNYQIFQHAHFHLIEGKNLYQHHPEDYCDLFKYSPTFALAFGSLAYFPDWLGITLWNLINALLLFWAIRRLPIPPEISLSVAFFVALEMTTNMQNEQSNALMAGLMVLVFALLERKQFFWAMAALASVTYIKIFGFALCALLLFYPSKVKNVLYLSVWMGLLFILPVLFTPFENLLQQYVYWGELLKMDHDSTYQLSFMHGINAWFGLSLDRLMVALGGLILLLISILKVYISKNDLPHRLMILSSLLMWVILFNHKAESPTYIIAMVGVGIWYFLQEKNKWIFGLVIFAFIFTSLSPTDLFPKFIRIEIFRPLIVKAMGATLIWFKLWYDLMFGQITFRKLNSSPL